MEFRYASFFKRLVAYLIDILPISFLVTSVTILFFGFGESWNEFLLDQTIFSARKNVQMELQITSSVSLLIWIIYSIFADSSAQQGTLGKKIMRIKVVNEHGKRLSFEESFKRNTCKAMSSVLLNIGYFWMLFDSKKQTWHDKIAETFVVDTVDIKNK